MNNPRIVINPRPRTQTFFVAKINANCDGCGCKTLKGDLLARTHKGQYLCQECATK